MRVPPKFKAGCGVVLVFASGFVCGVIAIFIIIANVIPKSEGWKRPESKEFLARHLGKRLALTEEQAKNLRPGFDRFLEQRWALRSGYVQDDAALLKDYLAEIESELTPEQVEIAHEIIDRWWRNKREQVPEKKAETMEF